MSELGCCEGFTLLLSAEGQKGFAVLVRRLPTSFNFVIQARFEPRESADGTRQGVVQTGLCYCPFCGTKLSELVDDFEGELAEKAILHEQYVL
ncbi:hypothetical protein OAU50_04350 [Planctomycetota bacterium]|nr:hypothetical protein [Planctomycetota bacterium]